MSHLEHDMDELFLRAAENYPLKSGESNWETIAGRLKDKPAVINKHGRSTEDRKKYLFALLLLLIALLLTNTILIQKNNGNSIGKTNKGTKESNQVSKPNYSTAVVDDNIPAKNLPVNAKTNQYQFQVAEDFPLETKNEMIPLNKDPHWQLSRAGDDLVQKIGVTQAYSLSVKNRNTPPFVTKNTIGFAEDKRFYWGILAGPQINEVKQQGIRHTDVDAGILAGYRINSKLAIEAGLFYGEKCYYSDAKYFKMSPDPSMPANMVLMDLEGKSNVVGIPIKLRYDLVSKRNNKFFATAGFSSYLLTKENNNYHSMINGSENFMEKSYNKNSCYAAANVNVSAGFEHRIMKDNFIRVEPYLQIPIKGIGVGSMPVTSAGIHIGIMTNKRKR